MISSYMAFIARTMHALLRQSQAACASLGRIYEDKRLQQQLTSRRDRQPPMMTVRCRLRHVWRPGLASITACSTVQFSIARLPAKVWTSMWTDGLIDEAGLQGADTCTAAGLMDRQPLMLRLLRWRSFSAHAAMEASVSFRQQCRPRAVNLLQFSATATTPMSRTCTTTCHLLKKDKDEEPFRNWSLHQQGHSLTSAALHCYCHCCHLTALTVHGS